MPIYWGDYLADTMHLTTLQHGAYLLLIAHYWQHGGLPNDEEKIAAICRLKEKAWISNCQAIAKLFLQPGWRHKRIDRELEKAEILSAKRQLAGQRGGHISRRRSNPQRYLDNMNGKAIAKQTGATPQLHKKERGIAEESEPVDNGENFGRPRQEIPVSGELADMVQKWIP